MNINDKNFRVCKFNVICDRKQAYKDFFLQYGSIMSK